LREIMKIMQRLLLPVIIALISVTWIHCSTKTPLRGAPTFTGCPIPPEEPPEPDRHPGLKGLSIVPLGELKFEILSGTPIDFRELIGGNRSAFIEAKFRVNEKGETENISVDGPGLPLASGIVKTAIESWRYTPSCLTPEFTLVFNGSVGFYALKKDWGKPVGTCTRCRYEIKKRNFHLVRNYSGYK
jgi:hypothetical protein